MATIYLKNGGVDKDDFEQIEKIWIRQLSERGCEPSREWDTCDAAAG